MSIWLCRAGKYGEFEPQFFENKRIYCTWDDLSCDLSKLKSRAELEKSLQKTRPDAKHKTIINWTSQVWPFVNDMKEGDWVMLPSKNMPVIHIGLIKGKYKYDSEATNPFYHYRDVDWFAMNIPRNILDQDILYSLGSLMTICRIKQEKRVKEIVTHFQNKSSVLTKDVTDIPAPVERDIELEALEEIANLIITKFKGHGLAKIVNAILKAKGFTTYLSPEGADGGIDILASSGTLGFGEPKICVQVKSGSIPIDSPTLSQLVGTMRKSDASHGLLVSWSGFKSSVIKETNQQFFNVRFWTHKEVIGELLANYDKLDDEIKQDVPLKRVWVINRLDD